MADGKDRGFKLGDISPLAGLVTGEGLTGKVLGGVLPMAMRGRFGDGEDDKEEDIKKPGMKPGMKRGGTVKKMAKGGSVSSASKRADGCAQRGKTRGKMR
jgi:hypothetical protein